jgi:uncharacterized membrane protein
MKPKTFMNLIFIVLVFSFTVLVLSSTILNVVFDVDFYKKEFSKYEPDTEVPIDKALLIMSYFRNSDRYINQESMVFIDKQFTQAELDHMLDVKLLIGKVEWAYFSSLIAVIFSSLIALFIIFTYGRKELLGYFLRKFFAQSLGFSIIAIIVVSLIGLIFGGLFYDSLFTKFHELFFIDGTWTFSETSLLIVLFPYQFFRNAFFQILRVLGKNLGIMFILFVLVIIEFALHVNKNPEEKEEGKEDMNKDIKAPFPQHNRMNRE